MTATGTRVNALFAYVCVPLRPVGHYQISISLHERASKQTSLSVSIGNTQHETRLFRRRFAMSDNNLIGPTDQLDLVDGVAHLDQFDF
jgi:hypothetical protein